MRSRLSFVLCYRTGKDLHAALLLSLGTCTVQAVPRGKVATSQTENEWLHQLHMTLYDKHLDHIRYGCSLHMQPVWYTCNR